MENAGTKQFRRMVFKEFYPAPVPRYPPAQQPQNQLSASFWKSLWDRKIPHNARNIWWRLLIGKLPSCARLHNIMPTIVAPLCRICEAETETDQHLLFGCPKKLEVWQTALRKYISDQDWTIVLIENFFYPRPPYFEPQHGVPLFLLLGTILATIWKYHHLSVRENEIFDVIRVSAAIDIAVKQVIAQLEQKKKQEDRGRPQIPATDQEQPDANFPT